MNSLRSALDSGSRWPKEAIDQGEGMLRMHTFEEMGKCGRKRLAIFPPVLASFGLCDGGNSRCIHFLFRGRRVTQTQSSARSFFWEGSMQQMNDWSRLAVDPARC